MENASKALLIAGGVLITMLIVMLLLFFRGKISEFYNEQGKIDDIENVAQFNKQFTNYERKKVYGYELISLANMVEDYNTRHSAAEGAKNDEKYNPITLIVSFPAGNVNVKNLWYDNETNPSLHLFKEGDRLTQSSTDNRLVNIITTGLNIENIYGNAQIAAKLAKSIDALIVNDNDSYEIEKIAREQGIDQNKAIEILKEKAVEDFKRITNNYEDKTYNQMENILLKDGYNGISIKKYYEYYQFKRSVFECAEVKYDNKEGGTGRVESITFNFKSVE